MRRTDDVFITDLWAIGRGRASVGGARRHRYRSIGYSNKCCLLLRQLKLTNNCFSAIKF